MKSLCFILIIALTIQPLQAGVCAMAKDQGEGPGENQAQTEQNHHHSMAMEHAATMSHGMSHGSNLDHSDGAMPDCCDSNPAEQPADCADMNDCGSCFAGGSVLIASSAPLEQWVIQYKVPPISGEIVPSHAYPPFRPPIS
jgi:hypothetical protein